MRSNNFVSTAFSEQASSRRNGDKTETIIQKRGGNKNSKKSKISDELVTSLITSFVND